MPALNTSTYRLQNLLDDYPYRHNGIYNSLDAVLESLNLPIPDSAKITIIGISGPTGAGKTSFSKTIAARLSKDFLACELSMDCFLRARKARSRLIEDVSQAKNDIEDITINSWKMPEYEDVLHRINESVKNPGKNKKLILDNLYNRMTGENDLKMILEIPYGGYLIVEGSPIHDTKTAPLFDCYIRLDVDQDNKLIERILDREKFKPHHLRLPEKFLRHRFELVDLPYSHYLRKLSRDQNHYLINTETFNEINVFAKEKGA